MASTELTEAFDELKITKSEEEAAKTDNRCPKCSLAQEVPHIPIYAPCTRRNLDQSKTHLWCSCGRSSNGPFCDEKACLGTGFQPVPFLPKQQTCQVLCGCRYTRAPPYCDGRHGKMPASPSIPPCSCNHPDIDW